LVADHFARPSRREADSRSVNALSPGRRLRLAAETVPSAVDPRCVAALRRPTPSQLISLFFQKSSHRPV
jgi:hypothetical protein